MYLRGLTRTLRGWTYVVSHAPYVGGPVHERMNPHIVSFGVPDHDTSTSTLALVDHFPDRFQIRFPGHGPMWATLYMFHAGDTSDIIKSCTKSNP